jgi:hypothetical protein
MPEGTPLPGQTRAIGMATNFVTSSDFNRISTARLPFIWASLMALRTSTGPTNIRTARKMLSPISLFTSAVVAKYMVKRRGPPSMRFGADTRIE